MDYRTKWDLRNKEDSRIIDFTLSIGGVEFFPTGQQKNHWVAKFFNEFDWSDQQTDWGVDGGPPIYTYCDLYSGYRDAIEDQNDAYFEGSLVDEDLQDIIAALDEAEEVEIYQYKDGEYDSSCDYWTAEEFRMIFIDKESYFHNQKDGE